MITIAAIALVILMASPFQHPKDRYRDRNPVVVVHATEKEAEAAARSDAASLKGTHYRTSGTSSMEPLVLGKVFVVGVPKKYEEVQAGDICNYRAKWANGTPVMHRMVQKDREGWIPSGDSNPRSEPYEKVKPDNYLDCVVKIHSYKGAEKTRVKK